MCENTNGLFLIEFEFPKREENVLIHCSDLVNKNKIDTIEKTVFAPKGGDIKNQGKT